MHRGFGLDFRPLQYTPHAPHRLLWKEHACTAHPLLVVISCFSINTVLIFSYHKVFTCLLTVCLTVLTSWQALEQRGVSPEGSDLIRHNLVVFKEGEGALQV